MHRCINNFRKIVGFWSFRSQETSWHVLVAVCGICSLPLSDLSLHMCIPMRTCGICVFIEATFSAAWRCVRVVRCASVGVCGVENMCRSRVATTWTSRQTDRQTATHRDRETGHKLTERQTDRAARRKRHDRKKDRLDDHHTTIHGTMPLTNSSENLKCCTIEAAAFFEHPPVLPFRRRPSETLS